MKNIVSKKLLVNLICLLSLSLSMVAATMAVPSPDRAGAVQLDSGDRPAVRQLDPDDRNYVMDTFTIERESMEVMVTKTASGPYPALKEYWRTNQGMLGAIAGATGGTQMTLLGVSHNGPAPEGFASAMRMQAKVTWGTASAPSGPSWIYSDSGKHICIKFNLSGAPGDYRVKSITWYLATSAAPHAGTYVFHDGPTYSLTYANAPALPTGFSWYAVTIYPGS